MINRIASYARPMAKNISFQSKRNVQEENDVLVRNAIRKRIEGRFDVSYNYLSDIDNLSAEQMQMQLLRTANSTRYQDAVAIIQRSKLKVDYNKLKQAIGDNGFVSAKRDNELYTGPRINQYPDGIKHAKESGINTIVSLGPIDFTYGEKGMQEAKENDIKLISIKDIGNKSLFTFAVIPSASDAPLLHRLMDYPEGWATVDENGKIKEDADKSILDAQEFIDILNGNHKDYPLPIYYGCDYGTNKTYSWHSFYNILKDCDRTKPLDKKTVEKLARLYTDLKELYKH